MHSNLTFSQAIDNPSKIKTLSDWLSVRKDCYNLSKNYFIIHAITHAFFQSSVSGKPTFRIAIYIKRHWSEDLSDIVKAEFFLGRWWGNKVFEAHAKNGVIGIKTAAYGEMLCICRLTLKGTGEQILLSRYIDFEMGKLLN